MNLFSLLIIHRIKARLHTTVESDGRIWVRSRKHSHYGYCMKKWIYRVFISLIFYWASPQLIYRNKVFIIINWCLILFFENIYYRPLKKRLSQISKIKQSFQSKVLLEILYALFCVIIIGSIVILTTSLVKQWSHTDRLKNSHDWLTLNTNKLTIATNL